MVLLYQDSQVPQQLTDTPLLVPMVPLEAMPSSSSVLHLEDIPLLVLTVPHLEDILLLVLTVPPLPTELPVLTALLLMVLPPLMAHQRTVPPLPTVPPPTVLLDTVRLMGMIAAFPLPVFQVLYQVWLPVPMAHQVYLPLTPEVLLLPLVSVSH